MSSTRIKFCGITRESDARFAAELGVDAVGFVLAPGSPRFISAAQAAIIRRLLPGRVRAVALMRNAPARAVDEVIAQIRPDVLQFHGEESPEFCAQFGLPFWRAVPMGQPQALGAWAQRFADAEALLLDAHVEGGAGGTGRSFDWSRVARVEKPLVLAGGLDAANVREAVARLRPWAVDVSSGIEARPGIKDQGRMRKFVEAVRSADGA